MSTLDFDTALAVSSPGVVSETIEGEVIIINLDSGAYFSARGVAADIWGCIERWACGNEIVDYLSSRYDGDPPEMRRQVGDFLAALVGEELVVSLVDAGSPGTSAPHGTGDRRPFEAPVLEKFTDMEDFLMVDPIHEVDDRGWPHKKG